MQFDSSHVREQLVVFFAVSTSGRNLTSAMLYFATVWYCMVWYGMVWYDMAWYGIV